MRKYINILFFSAFTLIILTALYIGIMTLAFMIPTDGKIKDHLGNSLFTLKDESRASFFDDAKLYWNDTFSDMIWMNISASRLDESAFYNACYMPYVKCVEQYYPEDPTYGDLINAIYYPQSEGSITASYARYWMIEVAFWKVLFLLYEIKEIRFLLYFIASTLIVSCLYLAGKKMGWRGVLPLSISMIMRLWLMNSIGLSIGIDIFISLIAMIIVLSFYGKKMLSKYSYLFYLILGSLSYAIGPMVAPLLTLAMPLILQILLEKREDRKFNSWLLLFGSSIQWVIGYAITIFTKAFISKNVLGEQDSFGEALYYLGPNQGLLERWNRILYCLDRLLSPVNVKGPLLFLIIIVLIIVGLKRGWKIFQSFWQILLLGLFPFVWVFIIVEHSNHNFVTNIWACGRKVGLNNPR